jgi:histidinol dehydrogenase
MKTYSYNKLSLAEYCRLLKRPSINVEKTFKVIEPILKNIKKDGLNAALKYIKKFDNTTPKNIRVSDKEFIEAGKRLDIKIKKALQTAAGNIEAFHRKQIPQSYKIEPMPGINCSREFRAIQNVGLYIPGGNAVLPSTLLMLGIPAVLAGCKRIVACSPSKNGNINDVLLYAAKLIGIKEFYKIGGAQAVALMAFGDKKIKKVDKIFGPGNQYVTAAKLLVSIDADGCQIDMPAGPSEVLVIADENANPFFIAADLLSQAEHGSDSQVVFISTSSILIKEVTREINWQIRLLPRKEFAAKSIEASFSLLVKNLDEAFIFSNDYAPEHLILHIKNPEKYKSKIINAGSVFLGEYSPESVGDYASGTNHSLPTYGYAKSYGGVSVESFMKAITFQKLSKQGLIRIAETVKTLAEVESLDAHKKAVAIRIKR